MIISLLVKAIRMGTIFLFGSTGETVMEKSGHLNLGIPGIMCMGAFGGCAGWFFQTWKTEGRLSSWDARVALSSFETGMFD